MIEKIFGSSEREVANFIASVDNPVRRQDAAALDMLFRQATGFVPRLWSGSIIGYGRYHYRYESGREGDAPATGFSPRKANLVVYIMPGYTDFGSILGRLGKYKIGKSCLYLNKLADIDVDVLAELVKAGLDDLGSRWTIHRD